MKSFLRRVLLAALLVCVTAHGAIPTNTRYTVVRTPSGKVDTRYLDGDDGTAAIPLTWVTIPTISVATGATGSVNLRTLYLTEPGSPNATLTTECTPALAGGFTATADGLSWSATTAYAGLCKTTAVRSGFTAISNEYVVTAVVPPSGDTTAPTIPAGVTIVNNTGSVDVTFDASSDPYVSEAASGIGSYQVEHSVDGVATVSSSGGVQPQLTLTNVGTLSPAPSVSQSGADWQITSAGTIDGTASAFGFVNAVVAGTACATGKVTAISNTQDFAKFGVLVADSTNASSRYLGAYVVKLVSGTLSVQIRRRQTDGASAGTLATVVISALPAWVQICESASGVFTARHSLDGNTWIADVSDYALPMSASKPWGVFGTATTGGGGATATGTIAQFNLSTQSRITYNYVTTHSGTVRVRARDTLTNTSSYGATVAVAPATPSATGRAFHPGHYAWIHCGYDWRVQATLTCLLDFIDSIASSNRVTGVLIRQNWASLEGATAGDYQTGMGIMDQILARAALRGKRVILAVHPIVFGGYSPSNLGAIFPQYIVDNTSGQYGLTAFNIPGGQTGITSRIWQAPSTDRLIAMATAYGARYGNTTGNNAYFEMWEPGSESAINVTIGTDGYTTAALIAQTKRLYAGARTAWPTKGIRWHANYLGNSNGSDMANVMADCATLGCVIGGPDVLPNQTIVANQVYKGETAYLSNQRLIIPFAAEVQSPELCGKEGSYTPQQLYEWAMDDSPYDSEDSSYFIWYVNTGLCFTNPPTNTIPDTTKRWSTGILPYIQTNPTPLLKTTCPTSYTNGCVTN